MQERFLRPKRSLADCKAAFQTYKVASQNARAFFAAEQAPRKSEEKILKGKGVGDDLGERANS